MTEAYKKGILDEEQTQIPLAFGDVYGYKKAITNIANKKNKFYEDLGKGTQYAASKYGGKEFAGILGGHEMAGYHTGYGNLLGIAVGARHSHLDNGGYAIDQKIVQLDKEKLVELLIKEEIERNIYNCLVICLFARKVYDIETIVKAFNAIGIKTTAEELYNVGKRIFAMKIAIKKKLGFEYRNIQFPKRYFETKTPHGQLDESIAEELLNIYVDKMEALCGEISDLFLRVDQRKKLI
jgi:aldehyde:ferredoxin oxidoreductase